MANRTKTHTYLVQNVNTQQPTSVPPTAVPFVTVTVTEIVIDQPSAPGPL